MAFQTPLKTRSTSISDPSHPRHIHRSPAAPTLRRYGPCVQFSKAVVKFLALTGFGFGISMLMFAAMNDSSNVERLAHAFEASWKPLTTLVLCTLMLGAIEDSFR